MSFVKKAEQILIAEAVLCVVVCACWRLKVNSEILMLYGGAIQFGILMCSFFIIVRPLRRMAEFLGELEESGCSEEHVHGREEKLPFIKQIYSLMNQYAAARTVKNSAQILNKQAELTALQSQINPHFLYNTLESIRGQALVDDNLEIAQMVEALSSFFRYSISRKGNLVTLRDELANIENYMMIQKYRFNNRFSLEVIVDEEDEVAYDFLIPRLIIQPVVENAIFHGLEEKMEGGKVTIEVIVTDRNLILTISDNGKGMNEEKLKELNAGIQSDEVILDEEAKETQRNTGIALPNIHKRIRLLFGEAYGVNIYSTRGQGTDVEITIPANYKQECGLEDEKRIIEN